jgi:hypothetical protein
MTSQLTPFFEVFAELVYEYDSQKQMLGTKPDRIRYCTVYLGTSDRDDVRLFVSTMLT